MVKIAFVFPGQGSQYVGMGKGFYETSSESKEMFDAASKVLGKDIASLCIEGPEDELKLTENAQPAILTHSIIALKRLRGHGIESVMFAGHSLGEYSALVAAGSLDFLDAVRLVQLRGRFMQEAVPVGVGGMAAILGLPVEKIYELCRQHSSNGEVVQPANMNSPEQTVIAGNLSAVEKVSADAKVAGAKKVVPLPVSAPFHCSLMKSAEIKLKAELEKTTFKDFAFPVINNVDAETIKEGEKARSGLVRQVCSPVLWVDTMRQLVAHEIRAVVEIGPGKVLSGLIRRYNKDIETYQVEDDESLEKTVAALKSSVQ